MISLSQFLRYTLVIVAAVLTILCHNAQGQLSMIGPETFFGNRYIFTRMHHPIRVGEAESHRAAYAARNGPYGQKLIDEERHLTTLKPDRTTEISPTAIPSITTTCHSTPTTQDTRNIFSIVNFKWRRRKRKAQRSRPRWPQSKNRKGWRHSQRFFRRPYSFRQAHRPRRYRKRFRFPVFAPFGTKGFDLTSEEKRKRENDDDDDRERDREENGSGRDGF